MIVGVCMMLDTCVELIDDEGRGIMTEGGHICVHVHCMYSRQQK